MQRIKRRSPDIRGCNSAGGASKQIRVCEIGSTRRSKERQYATTKPGRGAVRLRRAVIIAFQFLSFAQKTSRTHARDLVHLARPPVSSVHRNPRNDRAVVRNGAASGPSGIGRRWRQAAVLQPTLLAEIAGYRSLRGVGTLTCVTSSPVFGIPRAAQMNHMIGR